MKPLQFVKTALLSTLMVALCVPLMGQEKISNWRPYDQTGVNVFEAPKSDSTNFEGLAVKIGGSFAQQYQGLEHSNAAEENIVDGKNLNALYPLTSGFNLASANLYLDVELEDGIRLTLENYMSSRHHEEFWVKGGYIQVDKLPMFNNTAWFDDYVRVKIGHFQINYGDQQFRRSDNGNALYNPFVGNYIMDAFATEIGGEVYLFLPNDLVGMVGMTNGLIAGDISSEVKKPSIYAKLAFDRQMNSDLRLRLSGSVYTNSETPRNTLYGGDRTGSRLYMALAPQYVLDRGTGEYVNSSPANTATTGRFNPGFSNEITSFQFNPFVKYKGIELFGVYEMSKGRRSSEDSEREVTQIGGELLYRFLPREQMYVGVKYNEVSGELATGENDPSINRIEVAGGWFATKNLLLKLAYINQQYEDFSSTNLYHEGEFNGFMLEAVVGF